ncbi:MAG TPA: class I SAM-dependent methyltransferase [Rhodocyclaceae bacterium]|nr:class I SAM-dependent methyltransferase [Rhodocyclaceae bacterium]
MTTNTKGTTVSNRSTTDFPTLQWSEGEQSFTALWHSEAGVSVPKRVEVVDDRINADTAYRLACEGTALLWRGDFQNGRLLLQALARRLDRKPRKALPVGAPLSEVFHRHRLAQSQRARTLGMLLLPVEAGYTIPLRRAPNVALACREAYGATLEKEFFVISLRELQGLIGAHEWRKKGVPVAALGASIHPHYGVFSPVRSEYVDLVAQAPLPKKDSAFDIGTGTGVLVALLVKRGVARVMGTDQDPRALACARENLERLSCRVKVVEADLFPKGKASLVVCNPPWLPGKPSSPLEHAVYDQDSRMLKGFLNGLVEHLEPGGEGWLILSDLAEHLGLRTRAELLSMIEKAGLRVVERLDTKPSHPKSMDESDPLYRARAAEVTSLWRLAAA